MKFLDYISEVQVLLEGGSAIKGAEKITQVEARHAIPDLLDKIAKVLDVDRKLVKATGSAGRKPADDDLSGDIDVIVEVRPGKVELALPKLAYDKETFRVMRGINVFSFAAKVADKLVQVDIMPVEDINYAEWSYSANERDLKQGLKGAHRNEVLFAIAHLGNRNVLSKDKNGEPLEVERYFYDLSKGLMSGKQSRVGKKGKITKNWETTDKHLLTRNPDKVAELMFGKGVNAKRISTFNGALNAVNSEKFRFPDERKSILDRVKSGLDKKGLKIPDVLA
jgi:hypothetical protein